MSLHREIGHFLWGVSVGSWGPDHIWYLQDIMFVWVMLVVTSVEFCLWIGYCPFPPLFTITCRLASGLFAVFHVIKYSNVFFPLLTFINFRIVILQQVLNAPRFIPCYNHLYNQVLFNPAALHPASNASVCSCCLKVAQNDCEMPQFVVNDLTTNAPSKQTTWCNQELFQAARHTMLWVYFY